ncbi:MAG: triphosphoribosyl-dephospho-CoA synthase [Burkholderiales bacterium]
MLRAISSAELAAAFVRACELEVRAFKPGNVSVMSAGHGMTAKQFLVSAQAAAAPAAAAGLTVGGRILRAIEATRGKVGCNTNLGIVLLCAPLIHAAQSASDERKLQRRVERILRDLTQQDAESAYRAIRLAMPGGLGNSKRHDVWETPQVTLLAAMEEAQDRDSIARQYANGFADVFEFGVRRAKAVLSRRGDAEAAMLAVYLGWLARYPDSHVERKFGRVAAREVSARAAVLEAKLQSGRAPRGVQAELNTFDAELKRDGINPGTSADLSVASLLALRLQELLQGSFTGSESKLASHRSKTKPQHVGA